jgi:hypothetical protein
MTAPDQRQRDREREEIDAFVTEWLANVGPVPCAVLGQLRNLLPPSDKRRSGARDGNHGHRAA